MTRIYYDLETTGLDHKRHGVHNIAGIVEHDGKVEHEFDIHCSPHPKALIEPEALSVCGITEADFLLAPYDWKQAYYAFVDIVKRYVDPYDKRTRAHLVGYNNRGFDDKFLSTWAALAGDDYLYALVWAHSIDVMVLAADHFQEVRHTFPSFKLARVAARLGIEVDKDKLHGGAYDVRLTYECYKKLKSI